ncbi:serine hydrolase domain-containing protein [Microbaculum marinum]|uniref:Serine hydrolase n=1 Tax=Microbaculum marinum TaxID=1764581 RepID=A0AAW9RSH5_9HYPH
MNRRLLAVLLSIPLVISIAQAAGATSLQRIARTYAKPAVTSGEAVGVGVVILKKGREPRIFTYGKAIVGTPDQPAVPFAADTLFEIGSVTKVFTTNLFAQYIAEGRIEFGQKLASFQAQLGDLRPKMSRVTLKELGDFTGGIIDIPHVCQNGSNPTCLPSERPPIREYTGRDFASYFANTVPMNYQPTKLKPPQPPERTRLPAPYFYSDFGIGLLGLLIASDGGRLTNRDFWAWYAQIESNLLEPLGMADTYLFVPTSKLGQRALGYDQALGRAEIVNGSVQQIVLLARGSAYASTPKVRIIGGGGTGAKAIAILDDHAVSGLAVQDGGSGYVEAARIQFTNGGSSTEADAVPVVRNGKLIGVTVFNGGAGYTRTPDVTIVGGRIGGTNATARAYVVDGRVVFVGVVEPGSGYVDPIRVVVEPGAGVSNVVPVWAPAGALKTSLSDMGKFARSAMRHQFGHENSDIDRAFRFAQKPYACTGPDPSLASCAPGQERSGLAWAVAPADPETQRPAIVSKNGGLTGFTTQMDLMPAERLGVVVFSNSAGHFISDGSTTGVAPRVAGQILNALYYGTAN